VAQPLTNYQNLNELKNTVTDLSSKEAEIKSSNDLQVLKLFVHGVQIQAKTDAIVAAAGILATNVPVRASDMVLSLGFHRLQMLLHVLEYTGL
jgi:hypothetical protein